MFSEVSLHWSERANHFWNWCHLTLSQAKIESSIKLGFTESMSLKGFSLLLCWSAIIIANHNVNNIEQMSMLKAKCDFDGGDCCPNENNRLWNTYCNDCQCLEWTWLVENSKGQFRHTLYWFTWLRIEIHRSIEKIIQGFLFFLLSCLCLSVFIWFFSYFSNPATLTKKWRFSFASKYCTSLTWILCYQWHNVNCIVASITEAFY